MKLSQYLSLRSMLPVLAFLAFCKIAAQEAVDTLQANDYPIEVTNGNYTFPVDQETVKIPDLTRLGEREEFSVPSFNYKHDSVLYLVHIYDKTPWYYTTHTTNFTSHLSDTVDLKKYKEFTPPALYPQIKVSALHLQEWVSKWQVDTIDIMIELSQDWEIVILADQFHGLSDDALEVLLTKVKKKLLSAENLEKTLKSYKDLKSKLIYNPEGEDKKAWMWESKIPKNQPEPLSIQQSALPVNKDMTPKKQSEENLPFIPTREFESDSSSGDFSWSIVNLGHTAKTVIYSVYWKKSWRKIDIVVLIGNDWRRKYYFDSSLKEEIFDPDHVQSIEKELKEIEKTTGSLQWPLSNENTSRR